MAQHAEKTQQFVKNSWVQFDFHSDYTEMYLIFDLISNSIFNSNFAEPHSPLEERSWSERKELRTFSGSPVKGAREVSVLMKGAWNLLLIIIVVFFAKGIVEHVAIS